MARARARDRRRPAAALAVALTLACVARATTRGAAPPTRVEKMTTRRAARDAFASTTSGDARTLDDARRAFAFASDRKAHALVTGGAGFIGSHCAEALLRRGYAVTTVDNMSRGNAGAVEALRRMAPKGSLRAVRGDLGVVEDVDAAFGNTNMPVDAVFHFAAIAYVGESMADPVRYYSNITTNTVNLLRVMQAKDVRKMIYSSTCATYGNVEKLPITESTPTRPINPYGKSKLYAENAIKDYALANPKFKASILRYFNVFGGDPEGVLGELPRAELREHGRISGACFDAAMKNIDKLTVMGTKHPTRDGTTIRDFVHVVDLVDAHIAVAEKNKFDNPPSLYNVGTGSGVSMREFVETCKKVTGVDIEIHYRAEPRPGDYAEVYANVDKIKHELGWEAKYTDLHESLTHAWKFRKTKGDTWES
jgi:UDP-arabinose 4-epimerase